MPNRASVGGAAVSSFRDELAKLAGLVRGKVEEFESIWAPKNPGTGHRVDRPARWSRTGAEPAPRGNPSGDSLAKAIALHDPHSALSVEDAEALAELLEKRLQTEAEPNAARLAVAGLVAAFRGRYAEARSLLEIVDGYDRLNDLKVARVARRWLVADAAGRGDWSSVMDCGATDSIGSKGAARGDEEVLFFVSLAGWHLRAATVLDPLTLQAMAQRMPDPLAATSFVEAATSPGGPPSSVPLQGDLVAEAVAAHARLLRTPATVLDAVQIKTHMALWDRCLASRSVQSRWALRISTLAASTSSSALAERLGASVKADVETMLLAGHVDLGEVADADRRGLLGSLIEDLEERLADELEVSVASLGHRIDAATDLPLLEECRQWLALRRQGERLARLCGTSGRLVAFNTLYPAVGNWACDLWNRRRARALPNAIFVWTAQIAEEVDDVRAWELYTKNREW